MKKLTLLSLTALILFTITACSSTKTAASQPDPNITPDVLYVNSDSAVITVTPAHDFWDNEENENNEAAILAADLKAYSYLSGKRIRKDFTQRAKKVVFQNTYTIDTAGLDFKYIFYKKGSAPKIVEGNDVNSEFDNYFN